MFGDRLKELRLNLNLRQEDLANILGVTRNTISKYENNSREPSYDILIKIADYFNISLDYLLGRTSLKTFPEDLNIKQGSTYNKVIKLLNDNLDNIDFIYKLINFFKDNKRL